MIIEQESEGQQIAQGFKEQVLEAREERKMMALLAGDERKTAEKIAKKVQGLFYKIRVLSIAEMKGSVKDALRKKHKKGAAGRPGKGNVFN